MTAHAVTTERIMTATGVPEVDSARHAVGRATTIVTVTS
jgi:hypothetical protein